MPNRDQTGPAGQGAMTGRGAGNCADDNNQDLFEVGRGRRFFGRGFRRGGWGFGQNTGPGFGRRGRGMRFPGFGINRAELDALNDRLNKLENKD